MLPVRGVRGSVSVSRTSVWTASGCPHLQLGSPINLLNRLPRLDAGGEHLLTAVRTIQIHRMCAVAIYNLGLTIVVIAEVNHVRASLRHQGI